MAICSRRSEAERTGSTAGIIIFISILVQVLQQGQPWGAGSGGGGLQHRGPLSSGQLPLYLQ